jgi:membrane protease YdiL (CAAX protease family)
MQKTKQNLLLVDNPIDLTSVIITFLSIFVAADLRNKYINSIEYPLLSIDCYTQIVIGISGLVGMFATRLLLSTIKGKKTPVISIQYRSGQYVWFFIAFLSYLVIQVSVIIFQDLQLFQVVISPEDVYAFFWNSATVEETLFRGFLVMIVQVLLYYAATKFLKIIIEKESDIPMIFINVICCLVSGFVFAYSHQQYKADIFLFMLTFLGGCSQAFFYIKTKNLLVCMVAHWGINFIYSKNLIQTLGI